jgi:hypothetical protein
MKALGFLWALLAVACVAPDLEGPVSTDVAHADRLVLPATAIEWVVGGLPVLGDHGDYRVTLAAYDEDNVLIGEQQARVTRWDREQGDRLTAPVRGVIQRAGSGPRPVKAYLTLEFGHRGRPDLTDTAQAANDFVVHYEVRKFRIPIPDDAVSRNGGGLDDHDLLRWGRPRTDGQTSVAPTPAEPVREPHVDRVGS